MLRRPALPRVPPVPHCMDGPGGRTRRVLRAAGSVVARFRACAGGISAVEFSLIAPILVLFLLGSVDLSRAMTAASRAGSVADSLGQIVSQTAQPLTTDDLTSIIRAAPLVDPDILVYARQLKSADLDKLVNLSISSVAFTQADPKCVANCTYKAQTVFSYALSGPKRPCGELSASPDAAAPTPLTLPTSVFGPVSMVVVDAEVFFKPLFANWLIGSISFRRSAYFRPRLVQQINATTLNCPGF